MKPSNRLKPLPCWHCGEAAVYVRFPFDVEHNNPPTQVYCLDKRCPGHHPTPIEKWNHRAPTPASKALEEAVWEFVKLYEGASDYPPGLSKLQAAVTNLIAEGK